MSEARPPRRETSDVPLSIPEIDVDYSSDFDEPPGDDGVPWRKVNFFVSDTVVVSNSDVKIVFAG